MSDRDRDLTRLFLRDIDRIELPPRQAWRATRPDRAGWSILRPMAMVTGAAAVLVAALVVGVALRERSTPAASPSPSIPAVGVTSGPPTPDPTATSVATPRSPSPTASPSAEVLDQRSGFTVGGATTFVRSETSDAAVSSFASYTHMARVSPDGRSVAYWSPVDPSAREAAVLYVQPIGGGVARALLRPPAGLNAGGIAWSSDGAGIVVGVSRVLDVGPGPGATPAPPLGELWTIDLATGATERIASRTDNGFWAPTAWDRGAKLVAAGASRGGGGFLTSYEIIDLGRKSDTACETPCPYAVRATPVDELLPGVGGVRSEALVRGLSASRDARYVLLVGFGEKPSLAWWPLAEPEKRSAVEFNGFAAAWRPGTSEIWWVGGLTGAGCPAPPCAGTEIVALDVVAGTRSVVHRGEYRTGLAGFRVDGTAAITAAGDPDAQFTPAGTRTLITFIDIATGRTASLSVDGMFGEPVRLD